MPKLSIHSLGAKLLLFSLLLVLVPGIVFAFMALASARSALEDAVGRQLAEVAHDTADDVKELLVREAKNMHIWARQDLMREVLIGDIDKHISRFLASLRDGDASYLDLLCTDAAGHVVAASNPELVGASYADRDWFRAGHHGEEFLSGPIGAPEYSQTVLELAAPIHNPDRPEEIIGVLMGLYDWGRASALAERVQQNSAALRLNVDVIVLNEAGVVIAASPRDNPVAVGQDLRAAGWLAAQQPTRHAGYVREPSVDALVGFARVKGVRRDWTALVTQPLREALAPVQHMQRRLALALASVLLVALLVAALLSERMSRPLRELTRATREIARVGETRRHVPVVSRDEIGQLAVAFNSMASDLKRAQDDLVVAAKFAFIGEVAAGIAHEVRTPLGILRSSAQILARSPANEQRVELIEMIIEEVDRLDRVVAGLLELARPREPLIEPTPLAPVLARALDFVDGQAREQGVTIRRAFAPPTHWARCDPEQIYQVALNLIVNALQILPRGGELTVRTLPRTNGRVSFEVSDNGPGIPADVRDRVFTPFFTMRKGGTGLGLALVQRMVQAHQGTVSVSSEVGRGTTFRVELPAAEGTR